MKNDLSVSLWGLSRSVRKVHRADRRRRARHPAGTRVPVAETASVEDSCFDLSWFDSSRALAQGLSVTEHEVGIDVLLRAAG